jgi:hypothetical protein
VVSRPSAVHVGTTPAIGLEWDDATMKWVDRRFEAPERTRVAHVEQAAADVEALRHGPGIDGYHRATRDLGYAANVP